jgi:multicomponent K+:H+ antiporter subunit D
MNHWLALPVVLPMVTGSLLLLLDSRGEATKRAVSLIATLALLALSIVLLREASSGQHLVYYLGNWPAPYGIVLVLDRLSALMLLLSALLASVSLLYAMGGDDTLGKHFHALFQFQLLGVNGAFLTGDLFNLFVFFEILLIASYCLLMHGGGAPRTRAAIRFVVLNLVGSSVFLIALALVYGAVGTLNIADLSIKVASASPDSRGLIQVGALLLLVVFGLKAAVVPLGFWLASAYQCAAAAVACLFAIMTKVGAYAIVRVHLLAFAEIPGLSQSVLEPWLLPLALATVVIGTIGVLASHELRETVAYLVVVSMGTLLAAVGLLTRDGLSASIFYLMHSTLIAGGLFLLADLIARQRADAGASLERARAVAQPALLGTLFFAGGVAVAGLPPLSGFAAKVYILQAAGATAAAGWVWGVMLVTGLLVIVSLSRAGSALFWRTEESRGAAGPARPVEILSAGALLACPLLLVVFGTTVIAYADATAEQLLDKNGYLSTVLGNEGLVSTEPSVGVKQ